MVAVGPTLIVVATGYASAITVLAAVALSIIVLCLGAVGGLPAPAIDCWQRRDNKALHLTGPA